MVFCFTPTPVMGMFSDLKGVGGWIKNPEGTEPEAQDTPNRS